MELPRWTGRFLKSTRGRIILLLRSQSRTVSELADLLEMTDNAVRAHLATLERDGLIHHIGEQPGTRKPHFSYALTSEADKIFPKAYDVILNRTIAVLKESLGEDKVRDILREVGKQSVPKAAHNAQGLDNRLHQALKTLEGMGGAAHVERTAHKIVIHGKGCPLAGITTDHAEACAMVEALLSNIMKQPVRECCKRGDFPQCCFEIMLLESTKGSATEKSPIHK